MYKINSTRAVWRSELCMFPTPIETKDSNGVVQIESVKVPTPTGGRMGTSATAERCLYTYKKDEEVYLLLQSGQGRSVKFAVVPRREVEVDIESLTSSLL